ncbi:MAG: hypothetical protein HUJ51_05375 [Eggerthellaceae bacterium]|nr:hypothetical protein [Eggerthellaceae bacterium]
MYRRYHRHNLCFLFATVPLRMVGLLDSYNNPVSDMAIVALHIATMVLNETTTIDIEDMTGAMVAASIIYIIAA